MLEIILTTLKQLTGHEKIKFMAINMLQIISASLEAIAIGTLYLLIKALNRPDSISKDDNHLSFVYSFFAPITFNEFILWLMFLVFMAFALKGALQLGITIIALNFSIEKTAKVCGQLMSSIMRQPFEFHLRNGFSSIEKSLNSTEKLRPKLEYISLFTTEIFLLSSLMGLLIIINYYVSLGFTSLSFFLVWAIYKFQKNNADKLGRQRSILFKKISHIKLQAISGIKEIRLLARENYFINKYNQFNRQAMKIDSMSLIFSTLPKILLETIFVGIFIILLLVLIKLNKADVIIPLVGTYALVAIRALPSLSRISYYAIYLKHLHSVEKSSHSLALTPIKKDVSLSTNQLSFQNSIKITNLSYRYDNASQNVLNNVNLTINKGDVVGFMGETGAGKSTLIDIIIGLLAPQKGLVAVDGIDIQTNLKSWYTKIGYVPQAIYLSDNSILQNIAIGLEDDEIDRDKVIESLKKAQAWGFVSSLPEKINTLIGERGIKLSGGQRQRLGVARSLYNNPEILFMDEATSALDQETETAVIKAINSLSRKKTILVVAHRLSTLRYCDKIYQLKGGIITQSSNFSGGADTDNS
ncbi:MAG: ABC transporter ATP-binding protein [SAR324 cluster bacterium]|nr:ABC transporter ATP-binding protein [SAR324 cluster bacterium]